MSSISWNPFHFANLITQKKGILWMFSEQINGCFKRLKSFILKVAFCTSCQSSSTVFTGYQPCARNSKNQGYGEQVYQQSWEPPDYRCDTQEEPCCWSRKVFGGNAQTKARWTCSQGRSVVIRFGEGSTGTKAQKA